MILLVKLDLRLEESAVKKLDTLAHKHDKSREELIQEIIQTFSEFHS